LGRNAIIEIRVWNFPQPNLFNQETIKQHTMKTTLLILLMTISINSFGQATLVKDIGQGNNSSSPSRSVEFNGILYFSADNNVNGRELWKTDGTESGTVLFKEFATGSDNGIAKDFNGLVVNGVLYFLAWDGATFNTLWKTDGTNTGTVKVKSFPDTAQYADLKGVNLNGSLIFSVEKPNREYSLWKSDGTESGTILLKDTKNAAQLIVMGNEVFFEGDIDDGTGAELWKTNGTVAGTVLIKDIRASAWGTYLQNFNVINGNTLIFTANDGVNGNEWWTSDGTAAGTAMVKDIASGAASIYPDGVTVFNNEVFFTLLTNNIYSLWKTDGTDTGTTEVKSNIGEGRIGKTIVFNNELYIFRSHNSFWKSDGTEAGTLKVNTNYDESYIGVGFPKIINGNIFFSAKNNLGNELWKTDGTEAGTVLIKDVSPYNGGIGYLNEYNGQAIFVGGENTFEEREIWISDGTEAGTVLLKDIDQTGNRGGNVKEMFSFNNKVYFSANNHTDGVELWKTDGTTTALVKDINVGPFYSNPNSFVEMNGFFYFKATTNTEGTELWKSDGTEAGTVIVKDINIGADDGLFLGNIVVLNNVLYFYANDGTNGRELWKSDGTEAGTVMVKDINDAGDSNTNSNRSVDLFVLNNAIYFNAHDNTGDIEVWKSDGTEAGTLMLKNINASGSSQPDKYTLFNNSLYFIAIDGYGSGEHGKELWKTDGTEAGTVLVKDIYEGTSGSDPDYLTVSGANLFFKANNGWSINGNELWKTDGTTTSMVKDINIGSESSYPGALVNHNDVLFFVAREATHGQELWKSDGTEAGTIMVKDAFTGTDNSNIISIVSFGNVILYGNSVDGNNKLWKSDGTESGTELFQDINYPQNFYVHNTTLYFTASDGLIGAELYKLNQSALAVDDVSKEFTKVTVFPNPTNGMVSLKIENQEIQHVKVYSVFGKEVMHIDSKNNHSLENINLTPLSSGIYLLKIKTATHSFTRKVIKK